MAPVNTAILIATYKRVDSLEILLRSLASQEGAIEFDVVVVDNDPRGTAKDTVSSANLRATYLVETQPGIAAARNAGLRTAGPSYKYLAFIDDDECASPNWLDEMVRSIECLNADAVAGPVIPVYDEATPEWVKRGRFFERPRQAFGAKLVWPATNNMLVRRSAIDAMPDPWFDEAYSLTGGSDTDFFHRMRLTGAVLLACTAKVYETVPTSRANAKWLWRRNVRLGNVSGRNKLRSQSRPAVILIGLLRIMFGCVAVAADLVRHQQVTIRSTHVPKGIGMIGAATGILYEEYRRR